ncbi:MAG: hypothetical protein Q7J06_11325 [Bacteroidales bacterium]|nr:hypothetical protein [Bacteroidales bacterium]
MFDEKERKVFVMKRINIFTMISFLIFLIFLQGCATDKTFVKKDMTSISPLKIVRHETPGIKVASLGQQLTAGIGGAILLGGVGAAIATQATTGDVEKQTPIPDLGKLIMEKFVERVNKDIPNWPKMIIIEQPVGEDYAESCNLLEFTVNRPAIGWMGWANGGDGFYSNAVVSMKDSEGNSLWEKSFTYISGHFKRSRSIDEFLANDKQLLKEEIKFAAEKTVSDFMEHFRKGKSE